jgi:hypothetical protein
MGEPQRDDATVQRPRLKIRRRLDTAGLRWQARLDTPWVDRTLPWLIAGALAVALTAIGFAIQRQLDGGPNLAVWTQASWNLEHGRGTVSSLAGGDMVRDQWAFATLPLLWLGQWLPIGGVLAVAQPVLLAVAVVPLWKVAREIARLRLGVTAALALAYCLAPVIYSSNSTGWSAVVPAVPAIAWAMWFGQRRRWAAYALCILIALLSRADVGVMLVALGILGITQGDRKSGWATAVVGAGWTIAFFVIQSPEVPQAPMTATEAVLARGTAPLAVLSDPVRLVTDLVIEANLDALVSLVGPLLFLPLVVPRFALPAFPPIILGLVGEEAVREALGPQIGDEPLPAVLLLALVPLILATIAALARLGVPSVTRIRVDHRLVAAMVLATVTIFVQVAPASPFNEPWSWGGQDGVDGARLDAVDKLDELYGNGPVTVSPQLTSLVAERRQVEQIAVGPTGEDWRPRTRAVVLDTSAVDEDDVPLWTEQDRADVRDRLVHGEEYDIEFDAVGIIVFLRPLE